MRQMSIVPRLFGVLLIVLLLMSVHAGAADSQLAHRITGQTQRMQLSDSALFTVDVSGKLTAAAVAALAEAGGMQRVANPRIPLVRIDRGEAFWLKLDMTADASAAPDWLLEVEKAVLDRVTVFTRNPDGSWTGFPEVGAAVPFSARAVEHRHFVFPVRITPGSATSFLVRVQYAGPATPRIAIWQPQALQTNALLVLAFSCLYFGLVAGMLLYNLLLFVAVKDWGYVLYAGCVACTALAFAGQSGLGAQYVWGESTWWNSHQMYMAFAGALGFAAPLTRQFLQTRQRWPALDLALAILTWAALVGVAAAALAPSNIAAIIIVPLGVISAIVITGGAVVGAMRGWAGAQYLCAAWGALYFGVLVTLGRVFTFLPDNVLTNNILAIASAVEMVLLSLALADRINEERRQKEKAQGLTMGILQASQALGSETRLDRLHARVCDIVAELTGAHVVRMVLRDADARDWFLIEPDGGGKRISVQEAADRNLIVLDAVLEVERTLKPVEAPPDWLILPILHHGSLSAMLALESRNGQQSFAGASAAIEGIAGSLAVSLENVLLYERLEHHVAQRTQELRDTQQELVATARRAGMAEIATNVLHNVGNTLNSVNVSAQLMRTRLAGARATNLPRAADLLDQHQSDLAGFFKSDERGKVFPRYLRELGNVLTTERQDLQVHLDHLIASVDHIKRVVATQQTYAGPSVMVEPVVPGELVEEALRIAGSSPAFAHIEIVRQIEGIGPLLLDKTRTLQILINLIENAMQAMVEPEELATLLTVRMESAGAWLRFHVQDSGCGISPENLTRIFSHGFTTRREGHGFGLHGCALAAKEMRGRLSVQSDGARLGAVFTLELPLVRA